MPNIEKIDTQKFNKEALKHRGRRGTHEELFQAVIALVPGECLTYKGDNNRDTLLAVVSIMTRSKRRGIKVTYFMDKGKSIAYIKRVT